MSARVSRVRFSSQQKNKSLNNANGEDHTTLVGSLDSRPSFHRRKQLEAKVTVYDCAALMPYSRELAEAYILPHSPEAGTMTVQEMCQFNAQVGNIL
jgi:hypothetical protein